MRQWQARQPVPAPVTSITSATVLTCPKATAELTSDSTTFAQWQRNAPGRLRSGEATGRDSSGELGQHGTMDENGLFSGRFAELLGKIALQTDAVDEIELRFGPVDALLGLDHHALHQITTSGVV